MNKVLEYNVTGQNIELASAAMLVAGTVNEYTARFSFNSEWNGYQRVAVFNADGTEREQLLTDDACKVPWEVLLPGAYLKVGVYGTKDGSRLPTIWTSHRQYIHDGAGPTEEAADPSPVLAEQILQRMGDLGALKTEDKSSLVAAINEVKETGGGGGTADHSKLKNRDAADQHPMSAITGLEAALDGKQTTGDYLTKELDPTVPEWAKQPQKPAYTAQEVGALPVTTKIPSALSELSEDTTHRVVTDAEKAEWNAKSNFTGSYNDLTDKPTIPDVPVQSVNGKTGAVVLSAEDVGALPESTVIPSPYTLPIASSTKLGGVKPVAKTDAMTQSVGVDEAGALWAPPGSGGGGSDWRLIKIIEITEEVASISFNLDDDGNPFEVESMLIYAGLTVKASANSQFLVRFSGNRATISSSNNFLGATAKSIYWETHWSGSRVTVMGSSMYDFTATASTANTVRLTKTPQKITSVTFELQDVTTFTAGKFYIYGR